MRHVIIATLGAALIALGVSGIVWGDHDDERGYRGAGTATHPVYQTECGGCHLAYPAWLLPATAWERIMGSLADHFGDDASLDPTTVLDISAYLRANATSRRELAPTGRGLPRITQTRYFLGQHDEVPDRLARGNAQVGSFSNCQACHGSAAQGSFDEDEVRIPGVGRWED